MRVKKSLRRVCGFVLVASGLLLSGCGGDDRNTAVQSANSSNSKRLANVYTEFQATHNWFGPKNEEDMRAFIETLAPSKMELAGIDPAKIDDLFISERDGKPFKIRYKVRGGFYSSDPVIFEDTGVDGSRIVGYTGMEERIVDSAEEYDKLFAGKGERQSDGRGSVEATYGAGEGPPE